MEDHSKYEKLKLKILDKRQKREHFHQEIELLYILEGTMELTVAEKMTTLRAEDLIVVNANKRHGYQTSDDILFAQVKIAYEMVSDVFQCTEVIFWCDSTKGDSERFAELRKVMKRLLGVYLSTNGNSANFGHIALCYRVLDILSVHFLVRTVDRESKSEEEQYESRIMQINNYIRANYQKPVSLKELAEKLYLSNGYLSRFFKKNYGMGFAEYLNNIRLYHAVDDLLHTDYPITRIAYDNGFTNVAMFNKCFRKAYRETPSEMRRKKSKAGITEQAGAQGRAGERLEQYLQRNGQKLDAMENVGTEEAEHSVQTVKPLKFVWSSMINAGSAADLLHSEVREHILFLKEALHFKYVRFWNIFSKEMLIDTSLSNGEYNFSQLDSILDFLLRQGLKPILELGQKPKRIQRTVQEMLVFDNTKVQFDCMDSWERVIQAVFRHIVNKYGREETALWMVELWYDEDCAKNKQRKYDYFAMFNRTYEIIRTYSSSMKFGGCGFRMGYYEQPDSSFLEEWKKQRCTPDFISTMYYAYERGEIDQDIYSKRSTDNEGFLHMLGNMREHMRTAGFGNIPLYVMEWNLTVSDRNFINDTCFKGAYVMKNILDIYDKADMAGYFVGSDRVSEYYDTSGLLFGGTGLITKDGILKPAGFAVEFLNRLYHYEAAKGKHYLITTDQHDNYGIVCHNQKRLDCNYYFTKEDEVAKEQIWKYFEDREALDLRLHLKDLADGIYKAKLYRINDSSGSVMNIWQEMEFEKELSRNDIKYFRRVCEPKLTIKNMEVKGGRLDFSIKLEANEIAYIRISRQF